MNRPQKFSVVEGPSRRSGAAASKMPNIGERIAAFRERQGLSIEGLAEMLGVSRQAVWYWETGQRAPGQASLAKLAALTFGVSGGIGQAGYERTADAAVILRETKDRLAEDLGIEPEAIRIVIEG